MMIKLFFVVFALFVIRVRSDIFGIRPMPENLKIYDVKRPMMDYANEIISDAAAGYGSYVAVPESILKEWKRSFGEHRLRYTFAVRHGNKVVIIYDLLLTKLSLGPCRIEIRDVRTDWKGETVVKMTLSFRNLTIVPQKYCVNVGKDSGCYDSDSRLRIAFDRFMVDLTTFWSDKNGRSELAVDQIDEVNFEKNMWVTITDSCGPSASLYEEFQNTQHRPRALMEKIAEDMNMSAHVSSLLGDFLTKTFYPF